MRYCLSLTLLLFAALGHEAVTGAGPKQVVPPQRPIVDAPVVPAEKAGGKVRANELVLGVALGGRARAYPLNMLTGPRREIINDTLGGRPIAATW
jgi:hypothetical protein